MRQAVILAGGRGSRLRERLGDLPKSLIEIDGIPLLERQLRLLNTYGFDDIKLLIGYKAERIQDFCAANVLLCKNVSCIVEEVQLGTAGALCNIYDMLEDDFLVVYGDTMFEVDLDRFREFHEERPEVAGTLLLHPNDHPHDSDLVEVDDDCNITQFFGYPHEKELSAPNLVNAALYYLRKFPLKDWNFRGVESDLCKDLFPWVLRRGARLMGYRTFEYIKDCGTPSRVDHVTTDVRSGKHLRAKLDHPQRVVILDRDGTINHEIGRISHPDQIRLIPNVDEGIKKLNKAEFRVCIATNQPVVARGDCDLAGLRAIHNKLESLLGLGGAYVDRIYYCPHHPDSGFLGERSELKRTCRCRKPESAMIEAALEDFNGAREESWLIGDTTVDILAANRLGLASVLVETGYAGSDVRYPGIPDFVVPDLSSAASLIVDLFPRYCNKLRDLVESTRTGAIIALGGQSRSGKSTAAGVISVLLRRRGITPVILNTDRWIKTEIDRSGGVLGRHFIDQLLNISELLNDRTSTVVVKLPHYVKSTRTNIETRNTVTINPDDVVLLEGVVALYCAGIIRNSDKYFVDATESKRRSRLVYEYERRGEGLTAESIYQARLVDEFSWVQSFRESAIPLSFEEIYCDNH